MPSVKQIKKAVDNGQEVNWVNSNYVVIKDRIGQYLIKSKNNNNYIGLTWKDGKTLNGKPSEFKIKKPKKMAKKTYVKLTGITKKINGKIYRFVSQGGKTNISKLANNYRKKGWRARVIKGSRGWSLYLRKK